MILKMFKCNMKFTRVVCWINSKISNRDKNNTLMMILFCHYFWPLLWFNYWWSWTLLYCTSWNCLRLTVQILLSLYPYDPCWINNCTGNNMTGTSVDSKIRSKTKIQNVLLTLKSVTYCFCLEHHYQHDLLCLKFLFILAIGV